MWTRNGIDRTVAWPELAGLVEQFGTTSAVLDGELVVNPQTLNLPVGESAALVQ